MPQEADLLRLLTDRLRISVRVDVGPVPYESREEVRVKVSLLLDDETLTEDEAPATLPTPRDY